MPTDRAAFLDRDGIVNVRLMDAYVRRWEEFTFLPAIFRALPRLRALGLRLVLVTNQQGVARGLMTMDDVAALHARMQRELRDRCGTAFDAIEVCPHAESDACACRKPQPGMLTRAAARLGVDLGRSWMIGDTESDIRAGAAAGCRTIRVDGEGETSATFRCADVAAAAEIVAGIMAAERAA